MNPGALRPLLAPRSIAVVGASESPDSWAPEIYGSLQHLGFSGELIPVNPKYETVWGRQCLGSPRDLPRGVDLAVMVVPARVAVRMTEESAAAGVKSVMVVSSGFAETGPEGRELQEELAAVARKHNLPLLGPNVEGYVNYVDRVAAYGTTPPPEPVAGSVSVISQSGTVAWSMSQIASDRGFGLRIILGVGNEAVIGLGDMFEWAAMDEATRLVCTYAETLRDVEGIGRGIRALRKAGKPVLVCAPSGTSEAAQRSIVAHTGALAGNTGARDAWLRGLGAVLVEDPVTMFEAAVLLSHHGKLRKPGVAAALQSGGACTLFAEAAGAAGLQLPEFAPQTARRLRKVLPDFANLNNPLDVTGQAAVQTEMFEGALEALAGDPEVGFVAFDAFPPRGDDVTNAVWAEPLLAKARDLQKRTGVAFSSIAMSPLSYTKAAKDFVNGAGLAFLQGHRAASGAIRALHHLQSTRSNETKTVEPHRNRARAMRILSKARGPLDEGQAAALLSLYRIARPKERLVADAAEAGEAAREVGFPVAVKAVAPEIPHKAKLGGVALGLRTPQEVADAAVSVLRAARRAGAHTPKVLVQRMVSGAEVLVGAIVDPSFGPVLTMRPGGAVAEQGDAQFVAAPLTRSQASKYVYSQLERCGLSAAAHDIAAVTRAVVSISHAAADLASRLASLEANPLLVSAKGAVAVDALAEARH